MLLRYTALAIFQRLAHLGAKRLFDELEPGVVGCLFVVLLLSFCIASNSEAVHPGVSFVLSAWYAGHQIGDITEPGQPKLKRGCQAEKQYLRAWESLHQQLVVTQALLQDLFDLVQRFHIHHGVLCSEEDSHGDVLDRLNVGVDEEGCSQRADQVRCVRSRKGIFCRNRQSESLPGWLAIATSTRAGESS